MLTRDLKLIFASIFCFGFGYGLYFYLAPLYARQLGATPIQIGIIYTTFYLVTALVAIPGGLMADRFALKPIIVVIWFLMIPAGVIYYTAPTWQYLVVANIFAGLSMFNSPAMAIYIAQKAPYRKLQSSYTIVYSSFAAGMIVSPALGGYIAGVYNIRLIFLLATLLFAISSFVIVFISPAKPVSKVGERKIFALFRNIRFLETVIYFTAIFFVIYVSQPFLMAFLKEARGFSFSQVGILGTVSSIGAAILGPIVGFIADHYGQKISMLTGLGIAFLGITTYLSFFSFSVMFLAFFLFGIIEGFYNLSGAVVSRQISELPAGLAFGFFRTITVGAAFLGPYLGGWLYSRGLDLPFIFSGVAILTIMAVTTTVPFLRYRGLPLAKALGRRLRKSF